MQFGIGSPYYLATAGRQMLGGLLNQFVLNTGWDKKQASNLTMCP